MSSECRNQRKDSWWGGWRWRHQQPHRCLWRKDSAMWPVNNQRTNGKILVSKNSAAEGEEFERATADGNQISYLISLIKYFTDRFQRKQGDLIYVGRLTNQTIR